MQRDCEAPRCIYMSKVVRPHLPRWIIKKMELPDSLTNIPFLIFLREIQVLTSEEGISIPILDQYLDLVGEIPVRDPGARLLQDLDRDQDQEPLSGLVREAEAIVFPSGDTVLSIDDLFEDDKEKRPVVVRIGNTIMPLHYGAGWR